MGSRRGLDLASPSMIRRAGAVIAFATSLAVYLRTMAASASFWDSGEFIAAVHTLGIPHSPGTPLYVLVAKLFALLPIPTLSVAQRVNLLSAFCGAAGVLFVFLIIERLLGMGPGRTGSRAAALARGVGAMVGAFYIAFSDTYWNNAIEAEVYAMSTALMGLMTWLALRWGERPNHPRSTFLIYAMFYLLALSVGFHLGTVLVFSGIFFYVLMTKNKPFSNLEFLVACFGVGIFVADATLYRDGSVTLGLLAVFVALTMLMARVKRSPFALTACGLFALGLSAHLYLLIRSAHDPSLDMGDPESWRSLYAVLRREQYPPMNVFSRKAGLLFQLQHFNAYFQAQFQMAAAYVGKLNLGALLPVGLGIWGMVDHFTRHRKTFVMMFATLVVVSLGLILFLNFSNAEVRERDYFYSPAFYYFAVYIGVGAGSLLLELRRLLARRVMRLAPATYLAAGVLLILPMLTLKHHYFTHDRSHNTVCAEYGRNVLQSLDQDAILFTYGDNDTYPIWYAQEVEEVRPDVRVVNLNLINTPWYIKQCRDNEPTAPIAWADAQVDRLAPILTPSGWVIVRDQVVRHILQNNRFRRPVYFAVTIPPNIFAPYRDYLEFEGLVYRVVPRKGKNMVNTTRLEHNLTSACQFDSILTNDERRDDYYVAPYTERLITNYSLAFAQLAAVQHGDGRFDEAAHNMSIAHEISPDMSIPRDLLGWYYLDAGDAERALQHYRRELEAEPMNYQAMYRLSAVYERLGEIPAALDLLDRILAVQPDERELAVMAFTLARRGGFAVRARRYALAWLERHPDDADMRRAIAELGPDSIAD